MQFFSGLYIVHASLLLCSWKVFLIFESQGDINAEKVTTALTLQSLSIMWILRWYTGIWEPVNGDIVLHICGFSVG